MARLGESRTVLEAAEAWRDTCLLQGGSIFSDEALWTSEFLEELDVHFQPVEGDQSFAEKLEEQLAGAAAGAKRLAAEMLWVMLLFPSNINGSTKRWYVKTVWSWSGEELPDSHPMLTTPLDSGVGSAGQGYNLYRWKELAFFIALAKAWMREDQGTQIVLATDPWQFAHWLERIPDAQNRQLRHILLYLLFPEEFERIASINHKRQIVQSFGDLLDDADIDVEDDSDLVALDKQILGIRQRLQSMLPQNNELDFYWPPLVKAWYEGAGEDHALSPLKALRYRKQIILYGPPGTSKTHRAMQLAEGLIEADALKRWGGQFFAFNDWDSVHAEHIRRLQLHPAFSYEEFVRGLQITGKGTTEYAPGFLLRLLADIKTTREENRTGAELPYVVVLDEINRVDLSRMLGEVFSLLENREQDVVLPGGDNAQVRLPSDLFFIGTMNLIDQSLEQIDFALRRRFVWFEHNFTQEAALAVMEARWRRLAEEHGLRDDRLEQISPELQRLAIAAEHLNAAIRDDDYLGPPYQIGHTYFSETLPLLVESIRRATRGKKYFLWTSSSPLAPVIALWDHYLHPLLEQYVAGLDPELRREKLERWERIFLARPKLADV